MQVSDRQRASLRSSDPDAAFTDHQICRDNLTPEGCPLGPAACPLRHTTPSDLNFVPPPPQPTHPKDREKVNTVCKHYLRGLCIMGKNCEFLHEYNLRKFPECWWYGTYGFCAVGDECLYYHPKVRARECEDYNRGFCVLGETDESRSADHAMLTSAVHPN